MYLTRLLCGAVLIASSCASIRAQTAPLTPDPIVPRPFQFDASQYKGLLPGWPATLKPQAPIVIARQILLGSRPCAVARIMKPDPAIDPRMVARAPGLEIRSRDITEMNAPAPSCTDIAAPQALNTGPEKPSR